MTRTLLALILLLTSCGEEDLPQSLYRQRIANSPYVLYAYNYSEHAGLTLLDSSTIFSQDAIDKLPSSYFDGKPMIGRLKMLDLYYDYGTATSPRDTLLTPRRHYVKHYQGVAVAVAEYKQTYGSATMDTGLMEYQFDSCQEAPDSLMLYGVRRKFGKVFPAIISLAKGNIKAVEYAGDTIAYLEIYQAVIGRGSIYKTPNPFELVPNQPIVGMAIFRFYPQKTLYASSLSDLGIYKKVKRPPVEVQGRE